MTARPARTDWTVYSSQSGQSRLSTYQPVIAENSIVWSKLKMQPGRKKIIDSENMFE